MQGRKGQIMKIEKLMQDDKVDVTATYLYGELFSVTVYVKDADGYVDKTMVVYCKSGVVEIRQ